MISTNYATKNQVLVLREKNIMLITLSELNHTKLNTKKRGD